MMAFELAIIGVVVGIVLGLRYKILILVPAVLLAMIFAIIVGVGRADSFWSNRFDDGSAYGCRSTRLSRRTSDTRGHRRNSPTSERRRRQV
jgi:hypothetical protein